MRLAARMQHVFPQAEPVTVQAARFELLDRETGRHLATAIVAPWTMYATIRWPGQEHLGREHGPRGLWRSVQAEFGGLAIDQDVRDGSAFWRLLFNNHSRTCELRCVDLETITAKPHEIAPALDGRL